MAVLPNFADRLLGAIENKKNPSDIGLDTHMNFIPQYIKDEFSDREKYSGRFEGEARAILAFNKKIIDATHDIVPAYKPQIAFYEKYLQWGYWALEKTCDYIKENTDCLVFPDTKRNDIGNTANQYAQEFLGEVETLEGETVPALDVDGITVNGYLGKDGIKPFSDICAKYGRGIFVLIKTSNESSGDFQDIELTPDSQSAEVKDNNPLFGVVARKVAEWGSEEGLIGERGYSSIGGVVGATYPHQAKAIRKIMSKGIALVPGYGAQGGGGKGVIPNFNEDGYGAIVNNSRGVIAAYTRQFKDQYPDEDFDKAARRAAIEMKEDITAALEEAGILGW